MLMEASTVILIALVDTPVLDRNSCRVALRLMLNHNDYRTLP